VSLSAIFDDAVDSAFGAVGDLKIPVVVAWYGAQTYNPTIGEYSATRYPDSLDAVKYGFGHREVDGDVVLKGDAKFLVKQVDLSNPYRTYTEVVEGTKTWDVVNAESVPGDSIVTFHVRLQNG